MLHIVGLESLPNKEENQINSKYLAMESQKNKQLSSNVTSENKTTTTFSTRVDSGERFGAITRIRMSFELHSRSTEQYIRQRKILSKVHFICIDQGDFWSKKHKVVYMSFRNRKRKKPQKGILRQYPLNLAFCYNHRWTDTQLLHSFCSYMDRIWCRCNSNPGNT